jgi:diamine N-acetyltransferase
MIPLKGAKVGLRALESKDLDLLMSWENNPENWSLSGTVKPFSRSVLKRYLQNAHKDIYEAQQLRLIIETTDGVALGTLDFFEFDPLNLRCGLGILIAQKEQRQKGYAFEALQLACTFAFKAWGLQQIFANILESNTASQALFKKAGFEKTGHKKAWVNIEGSFYDEGFYQLLSKE